MSLKKGLSPVIASVLLILLVLVLAIIIFLWARGFVGEQVEKFGRSIESVCKSVDFDVIVSGSNGAFYSLEIVNRGNIGISGFDFKVYSGGNSEIVRIDTGVPAFGSLNVNVELGNVFSESVDYIDVFPLLKGNVVGDSKRKIFLCEDDPIYLEGI